MFSGFVAGGRKFSTLLEGVRYSDRVIGGRYVGGRCPPAKVGVVVGYRLGKCRLNKLDRL